MTKLVGFSGGTVVYSGKTDKYSYDKFFIQYRLDNTDEIILVYREKNKTVIEMIIAPAGDISQKEIVGMHGAMGFYSR